MRKGWIIFIVLMLICLVSYSYCSKDRNNKKVIRKETIHKRNVIQNNPNDSIDTVDIVDLEIPMMKGDIPIIRHLGYEFQYSEKHEQAFWVGYELTKKETEKAFERTNEFIPDPAVSTGTATVGDYLKSGYDRGHLAPAADMGWSQQAMKESFYFSNMSPQEPGFNRGIWKNLEEQVRVWAQLYDSVYVVTGPVLKDGLVQIGTNGVSIPKYYYKIILDNVGKDAKAIGFLMPNAPSSEGIDKFAVSIDQIEQETGIDFFYKLKDSQEDKYEKEICIDCWNWSARPTNTIPQKTTTNPSLVETQCKGTTKAGSRCKRMTSDSDGYCYQHKP